MVYSKGMKVTVTFDTDIPEDVKKLGLMFDDRKYDNAEEGDQLVDWIWLQDIPMTVINAVENVRERDGLGWDKFIRLAHETDLNKKTSMSGLKRIPRIGNGAARHIITSLKKDDYL